jgi:hypothetical protein
MGALLNGASQENKQTVAKRTTACRFFGKKRTFFIGISFG